MKLDANALRYMSKEEYRTLQAVELGQKNVSADSANAFIFAQTCSQEGSSKLCTTFIMRLLDQMCLCSMTLSLCL